MIYVFDLQEKVILKKFDFVNLVTISSPNWSPDGKQIVFSATNFAGVTDLYIVDEESGELKRLTNDFYDDRDPAWSPNANAIAFSSDRSYFGKNGHMNLFLYNLQTGKIQYLTEGKHNDYAPAWSPDGESLIFTSDRDGPFNIWMIKNNAAELEPMPIVDTFIGSPYNGQQLA